MPTLDPEISMKSTKKCTWIPEGVLTLQNILSMYHKQHVPLTQNSSYITEFLDHGCAGFHEDGVHVDVFWLLLCELPDSLFTLRAQCVIVQLKTLQFLQREWKLLPPPPHLAPFFTLQTNLPPLPPCLDPHTHNSGKVLSAKLPTLYAT